MADCPGGHRRASPIAPLERGPGTSTGRPRHCAGTTGMVMSKGPNSDPDDYFADTRMSFGDHIEELRHHLWKAIYGFLFALFFAFFIGKYVMDFITAPVKAQLVRFYDKRMDRVLSEKRD
ncbi:MAG: hypothetical protein ACKO23_16560, partial [Gemmataceae bacterium]